MPNYINIYLPIHVRKNDIVKVISKIVGSEFKIKSYYNNNIDFNKPSSLDNNWFYYFNNSKIEFKVNYSLEQIIFKDILNQEYEKESFLIHKENEFSDNYQIISARNTPLTITIGKRLIKFFGGTLRYEVPIGANSLLYVKVKKAKFPKRKDGIDSENYKHKLENLIKNENLLKSIEIVDSIEFALEKKDEKSLNLITYLKYIEREELYKLMLKRIKPKLLANKRFKI